jgi:transposase
MKPYRYIKIDENEYKTLLEGLNNGKKSHFRIRCHALILSHQGWKIESIASLYSKRLETIRDWMDDWELKGVVGLMIQKGRGRKATLQVTASETVELIKKKSKNNP